MSHPVVVQKSPYSKKLGAGTYWWCSCGKSAKQPFCDGSHKGSEFAPVKLELEEEKVVALCGCKHSQNKPICDGSHNKL